MSKLVDWIGQAREQFQLTEIARHVLPLKRFEETHNSVKDGRNLDARDTDLVKVIVDLFRALGRHYFRWDVSGVEHIPQSGPALIVGNHNGGFLTTDTFLTYVAVWDQFGASRALYGLGHDVTFRNPLMAHYAQKFGVLRAGHESAEKAIDAGHLVLVYPGSDLDTFRTWSNRHKIELGGRKGFIRLAIRKQIPIIPVVSAGTHEQFVVLNRGDEFVRKLGMKRLWRSEVLPIVFALPWGIVPGFLPYIPLPAQTSVMFGPPIRWTNLSAEHEHDSSVLEKCYIEVEQTMQQMLDGLSKDRIPLVGKINRVR